MSKLFSQECSEEYREKILDKVDEAKENGVATLEEGDEVLQFAEVEGNVIIEDQSAEPYEVTKVSENPEDENDLVLTAVDIPLEEEVHTESDTDDDSKLVSSIEIKRIPGPDGEADDIVEDLEIQIEEGIEDKEKSGTFSIRFKNVSEKYARAFAKVFSAMESEFDKVVDAADVDEDVEVKFVGEDKMKVMSITIGKVKTSRTFSESGDESEEKEETEEKSEFEEGFEEGVEYEKGKQAEEVDENKGESEETHTESETEETAEETSEESTEIDDASEEQMDVTTVLDAANDLAELAADGITKENAEEIKTKAEEILIQAEKLESEGAKMGALKAMCNRYSEECAQCLDAEATEEVTEEEKEFSDPKVTLTIENLEPASVSSLLRPAGADPVEEVSETEPIVDPNAEEQGRQFSLKSNKTSVNPYLTTEIK